MMLTIDNIAAITHAANIALVGKSNHNLWVDEPGWFKDGQIDGVQFVLTHREASPVETHVQWLAHKESNGWRYGIMFNEITKEHPAMVPFDDLDDEKRLQHAVFAAIVNALRPFLAPDDEESTPEP